MGGLLRAYPTEPAGNDGPDGDPDGDGVLNRDEYTGDTSPTDPVSVLEITDIKFENGNVRIDWKGGREATQYLQVRADLLSTSEVWTAIYTNAPITSVTNSVLDMGATNPVLFYRVKAARP